MARALPFLLPMQKPYFLPSSFTFLIVFTAFFSVFSVVTFMCSKNSKAVVKKVESRLSSKALLMARKLSGKKVQDDGGEEAEIEDKDGAAVWTKTIIKGGKCGPLDFSGRISYDSKGNLLLD